MMMSRASRRAALILAVVAIAVSAWSFAASGQCNCDAGSCDVKARPGTSESSFTLPLGSIVASAVCAIFFPDKKICQVIASGVLIDVEITLKRSLDGMVRVNCPEPSCCLSGDLWVDVYLYLTGKTKLGSQSVDVESYIKVQEVKDNNGEDIDRTKCLVQTPYRLSQGGVNVSLSIPGGIEIPLIGTAKGAVRSRPDVGCECSSQGPPVINHEPTLSVPTEVTMFVSSSGGSVKFHAMAADPDGDPLWFDARVSGEGTHQLELSFDHQSGHGQITIPAGVLITGPASVTVFVYDLKSGVRVIGAAPSPDQYYHQVSWAFPLRFNYPPRACDIEVTVRIGGEQQSGSCTVTEPDGEGIRGPRWENLPLFCNVFCANGSKLSIYVICDPRVQGITEGDYKAIYHVWDINDLEAEGTVVIHVRKNEPPVVERPG